MFPHNHMHLSNRDTCRVQVHVYIYMYMYMYMYMYIHVYLCSYTYCTLFMQSEGARNSAGVNTTGTAQYKYYTQYTVASPVYVLYMCTHKHSLLYMYTVRVLYMYM